MSSEIVQDEFCDWLLKKDGQIILRSQTPYLLLNVAFKEKLMTKEEILDIAYTESISVKYISSLSELEA